MRATHDLSRRALLVAGGLLLAGCATSPAGSGRPELAEGDVTTTVTWWGGDARTQATLKALDLFHQEHPTITLKPQFADWGGYWDRLATTTAGGEAPDLMQFDEVYLASYAAKGALADLGGLSEFLKTDALDASVLDSGRVDGTLVGLPIGAAPNGVIINTSLFEQHGVPVPDTSTWTWDEFNRTAAALSQASGGKVRGVNPFGSDTFSLNIWARQHGDELFNTDGDIAIEPATVQSYFDLEQGWIDSGAAPSAAAWAEAAGNTLDQSAIVTGEVAMMFIAAGSLPSIQAAAPQHRYTIGDWPTDASTSDGYQYLKPSMYWAISSRSKHPAETGLLTDFLTNDARVAELFGVDRGVPVNPASMEAISSSLDPTGQLLVDFTQRMGAAAGPAPAVTPNGASDVQTVIGRYNQETLLGQTSSKDAAQRFIDEVQASIDQAGGR